VIYFFLNEKKPNVKNMCAELAMILSVDDRIILDVIKNSKLIEFDFFLGLDEYHLKCDLFQADVHFSNEHGDVAVLSLFIDDYMKYCERVLY
tara:strand:- start:498 stop:773 length:276 start_codon:yes stop_codon:yes gene_type:complete